MRLLLDTNVLIPGEPTSADGVAANTPGVVALLGWANRGGHQLILHPAQHHDLARDRNAERRQLMQLLAGKYLELEAPPPVPKDWADVVGTPAPGTNDWVDDQLLAALSRNAVHYVVTEDRGIHRKAKRLKLNRRVLYVVDAIATLRSLAGKPIAPPPAVRSTVSHYLDGSSRFFDSLRADYPGFDEWLMDCQSKQRPCWVIDAPDGAIGAVCIYKDENEAHGIEGKILKLCTFKVDDAHRGRRLGELLLKAAFAHAAVNCHDAMYVTVFPKHERLIDLFSDFGFEQRDTKPNGEAVLFKALRPPDAMVDDPLAFHVRYGPPTFAPDATAVHVIPIEPRYHRLLFPDAEPQQELAPGVHPFANGLRKAYLCRASTRMIPPGAPLLFYRSDQGRYVKVIGVAEELMRSSEPDEIAAFVGKRTVYSLTAIREMAGAGELLAILFRQAVVLDDPITLGELVGSGALKAAPQSITRMKEEAKSWLRQRLEQSSCFPSAPSTPTPS